MNPDHSHDPSPELAAPLQALRSSMAQQDTPPAVEQALAAAFARQHAATGRRLAWPAWLRGAALAGAAGLALLAVLAVLPAPQPASPGAVPLQAARAPAGGFIALASFERIEQETAPRVLEADLQRTALAWLGVPVTPENAGESVRAEMLVGADGTALALRLTSLQP